MEFRRVLFRSVVIENSPVTNDVLTAARSAVPERIEHYFVTSPAARERLLAAGIATDRITELLAAPAERTAATMTVMGRLLAPNLKLIRRESSPIRRRREKNGRAEWRERGCQSGSIAVGAVTIKKKTYER